MIGPVHCSVELFSQCVRVAVRGERGVFLKAFAYVSLCLADGLDAKQ